eukprot:3848185-Lingulodinium_polyedra.AAC.1
MRAPLEDDAASDGAGSVDFAGSSEGSGSPVQSAYDEAQGPDIIRGLFHGDQCEEGLVVFPHGG